MCSCAIANNGCYSSFPLVFDNVRHALIFEHLQIGVFCLFFDNIFFSFTLHRFIYSQTRSSVPPKNKLMNLFFKS